METLWEMYYQVLLGTLVLTLLVWVIASVIEGFMIVGESLKGLYAKLFLVCTIILWPIVIPTVTIVGMLPKSIRDKIGAYVGAKFGG